MAATLGPLKSGSLNDRVFDAIRDAIFAGTFKSGEPLREMQLARDLQVSQSTVRESLLKLAHVGLVTRIPNKGTTVTELSEDEIAERLTVRRCLEELAFTEAAKRMDDEDFEILAGLIDKISEAIERNDYFTESQADLAFHRYVWKKSGNETLSEILNQVSVPLLAFVSMSRGRNSENLKDTVSQHQDLYDALVEGKQEGIRQVLLEHLSPPGVLPESARKFPSATTHVEVAANTEEA